MLRCRALYALALLGAGLFYVFYTAWFSFYVLILVLIFPLFSLAVSLPGMLGWSASLSAEHSRVRRGERAECTLKVASRWRMPVSRAAVRLEMANLLTGERRAVRERFSGGSAGRQAREGMDCPHCGCVRFSVGSVRVYDLLGLFSLRRPLPAAVEVLVLPDLLPPEPVGELTGGRREGAVMRPRPGGGPGEDYDLRPYRPGDPLRSVHWKLSSKLDDLVVRETLEPHRAVLLLTFDRVGPMEELDTVLARLEAVSRGLLDRGRPHYVQWLEPGSSLPRQCRVEDEAGLYGCLGAVCSVPAPSTGPSMLDIPLRVEGEEGGVRRLHLTPEPEEGGTA